jgi:hypothetical protein
VERAGPDLLIVAENNDELADRLEEFLRGQAVDVERVGYRAAAGRLTVRREKDVATVRPVCPIFLRPPAPRPPFSTGSARFHSAEIHGLVWAAAALSDAVVINRPGRHGFGGRASGSAAVLRRRAGLPEQGQEIFASHASLVTAVPNEAGWWLERRRSRTAAPPADVSADSGPYRGGRIPTGSEAFVACVVGTQVYITPETGHALEERIRHDSVRVAGELGLTFATLAWRRTASADPCLGRVNPWPSLAELGQHWASVRSALVGELLP